MNRTLAIVGAIVFVGLLAWMLAGRSRGGIERDADGRAVAGPGASPRRTGGVQAREVTVDGIGKIDAEIVDPDGQPIDGGSVTLTCRHEDGIIGRIAGGTIRIGEDGTFVGPACDGTVCIGYRHPAYIPATPWTAARGDSIRLVARPLPRLWGEVRGVDGQPVAAAMVIVSPPEEESDPTALLPVVTPRTSTDAEGSFSIARVAKPPCDPCELAQGCTDDPLVLMDRVTISARADGHGPTRIELELDDGTGEGPDAPVVLVLPAPATPITGVLHDRAGEPYPRAFVLARSEDRPSEQHRADAGDGALTITGLGEGTYAVRAIQDGLELAALEGVAPGDRIELQPDHEGLPRPLLVEIVDEGTPVVGAQVRGGPFASVATDASGQVRASHVAPGTYILRVDLDGAGQPGLRGSIEVTVEPDAGGGASEQRTRVDVEQLQRR